MTQCALIGPWDTPGSRWLLRHHQALNDRLKPQCKSSSLVYACTYFLFNQQYFTGQKDWLWTLNTFLFTAFIFVLIVVHEHWSSLIIFLPCSVAMLFRNGENIVARCFSPLWSSFQALQWGMHRSDFFSPGSNTTDTNVLIKKLNASPTNT